MAQSSVVIPQDIIDSIIAAVDDDSHLLKTCALVSSSFLLPSRKRLFSRIYLRLGHSQASQRLYQFLVGNPVVQTFVRSIWISGPWLSKEFNFTPLIALLRLPFCCLESFSISMSSIFGPFNWNDFSSELKDALSTVIHSATLNTLYFRRLNVPIKLFHGIHLTKLMLDSVSPLFDPDGKQSRLLELDGVASHMVIDHCVWSFDETVPYGTTFPKSAYFSLIWDMEGLPEAIFLPFMCNLRVFEIHVDPRSAYITDLDILSFLSRSLCVSLSSPSTLEHLKIHIGFERNSNRFDCDGFFEYLRVADIWSHLDSIITHPAGSQLQKVDIHITYSFRYDDDMIDPDETEVVEPILDALPLLREKGILFVKATNK